MGRKGLLIEDIYSSRIVSKGKITSLASIFKLNDDVPFTIYVRPKDLNTPSRDLIISCKLFQEDAFSDVPVTLFSWNELLMSEIAASNILDTYDIYWGAGDFVNK